MTQGHLIPWVDFAPAWKGWQSLGLSPDTIFATSNVREEFLKKFVNSVICSVGASAFAIVIGSLAAYGLSRFDYKFGPWRNRDISFFFISQLILPPVVLALPFLVLYKELALLDTRIGLILVYTLMVLPIVIWVMRDQFDTIPHGDGAGRARRRLLDLGRFFRIILPMALPGMVAAFILSLVLCWNEYFFASLLTGVRRPDAAGHGGEPDGLAGDQLVDDGGACDRRNHAAATHRHLSRALYRHGPDRGLGQVAAVIVTEGERMATDDPERTIELMWRARLATKR